MTCHDFWICCSSSFIDGAQKGNLAIPKLPSASTIQASFPSFSTIILPSFNWKSAIVNDDDDTQSWEISVTVF